MLSLLFLVNPLEEIYIDYISLEVRKDCRIRSRQSLTSDEESSHQSLEALNQAYSSGLYV